MTKETDRELLELAAKAAGYGIQEYRADVSAWVYPVGEIPNEDGDYAGLFLWRPRNDDGDAFRLLNSLELELRHVHGAAHAGLPGRFWCTEQWFPAGDKNAATRLAIVRAAAEIGRSMP